MKGLDLNTPLWQLTVGQFLDLCQQANQVPEEKEESGELVYGLDGLARLLGCSKTTAQARKSAGEFDEALYQTGRKVVFDKAKVLDIIKKQNKTKIR